MRDSRRDGTETMFTKTPFKPGAEGVWLGLPAEVYHRAPGVSQSTLKEFDSFATPGHYKARKPKTVTDDMRFGTICHTAILEPDKLADSYYVRPETYPDSKTKEPKPWTMASNWCKDWMRTHSDKPVIPAEVEAKIPKIVERVKRLDEFGAALTNGFTEVSFFKRDEITGLLLKCRVDCLAKSKSGELWLFDPKKVQSGCAGAEEFSIQAANLGYHIQAAGYLRITGASHFVFVPFDDDEPFDACQWEPSPDMIEFGAFEFRRILDAYAACAKPSAWPGYKSGINHLKLPAWAEKKSSQAQHDAWLLKSLTNGGQA